MSIIDIKATVSNGPLLIKGMLFVNSNPDVHAPLNINPSLSAGQVEGILNGTGGRPPVYGIHRCYDSSHRDNNYEHLKTYYPDGIPVDGPVPGTHGLAIFFDAETVRGDAGTTAAVNRLLSTYMLAQNRSGYVDCYRLGEYIDEFDSAMDEIGGWSIFNRDIITAMKRWLIDPSLNRNEPSCRATEASRSRANRDSQAVGEIISQMRRATVIMTRRLPITRNILRNSTTMAKAWRHEVIIRASSNLDPSHWRHLDKSQARLARILASAVKGYFEIRGSMLDVTDKIEPVLRRDSTTRQGLTAYNGRVSSACDVINTDTNYANGGPASSFDSYRINVRMAYAIAKKSIERWRELMDNGNDQNSLGGMFWQNDPSDKLPFLTGNANDRQLKFMEMLDISADLIARFPPKLVGNSYSVVLGDQHDDISMNEAVFASISICCECHATVEREEAFRHDSMVTDNSGNAVRFHNIRRPNEILCRACILNYASYAYDENALILQREGIANYSLRLSNPSRATGGSTDRTFVMSTEAVDILSRGGESCVNCGTPNTTAERVASAVIPGRPEATARINALAQRIETDSDLGRMLQRASGRSIGDPGWGFHLNETVELWDSGSPSICCYRCAPRGALYTDPDTNKKYKSIDSSPKAPPYGYILPDPSGRFLDRVIGIEFESGPGSGRDTHITCDKLNKSASDMVHVWGIHGDGSLMGGSAEIVTPPMGGLAIPKCVDAMFAVAKEHNFNIENRAAGMHIHTNITDVFHLMLPIRDTFHKARLMKKAQPTTYPDFCNLFGRFGDALSEISRKFVSVYRRHNNYCNGGFGVRSWGCGDDPMARYQSTINQGGRQAVCVHMHSGYGNRTCTTYTLENRIWPSSNSKEYTLARAELTQKAVNAFCELAKTALTGIDMSILRGFVTQVELLTSNPINEFVNAVCSTFNISEEGKAGLSKLHKRFFWISYYAQEHGLELDSQEIKDMRTESLKKAGITNSGADFHQLNEIAGILIEKGFNEPLPRNHPFTTQGYGVIMDTIFSSHDGTPLTTDQSDLHSEPVLTFIKH